MARVNDRQSYNHWYSVYGYSRYFFPNWWMVRKDNYKRPRWFAQGPMIECLKYLTSKRQGRKKSASLRWYLLGFYRFRLSVPLLRGNFWSRFSHIRTLFQWLGFSRSFRLCSCCKRRRILFRLDTALINAWTPTRVGKSCILFFTSAPCCDFPCSSCNIESMTDRRSPSFLVNINTSLNEAVFKWLGFADTKKLSLYDPSRRPARSG